jgi:hypothetical protein
MGLLWFISGFKTLYGSLTRIFHAFEMFIGKAAGVPLYACTASP